MGMVKSFGMIQVVVCVLVLMAVEASQAAVGSSVKERAATVVASSEIVAQGIRTAYKKNGIITTDINDLVSGRILSAYPRTSHPQADFYNRPVIINRGTSADYFIRYSFAEQDAADVCATINETALGLRPDSPASATSLQSSADMTGTFVFAPMPVEIAGKKSFCIRVDGNLEYFLLVMPVP